MSFSNVYTLIAILYAFHITLLIAPASAQDPTTTPSGTTPSISTTAKPINNNKSSGGMFDGDVKTIIFIICGTIILLLVVVILILMWIIWKYGAKKRENKESFSRINEASVNSPSHTNTLASNSPPRSDLLAVSANSSRSNNVSPLHQPTNPSKNYQQIQLGLMSFSAENNQNHNKFIPSVTFTQEEKAQIVDDIAVHVAKMESLQLQQAYKNQQQNAAMIQQNVAKMESFQLQQQNQNDNNNDHDKQIQVIAMNDDANHDDDASSSSFTVEEVDEEEELNYIDHNNNGPGTPNSPTTPNTPNTPQTPYALTTPTLYSKNVKSPSPLSPPVQNILNVQSPSPDSFVKKIQPHEFRLNVNNEKSTATTKGMRLPKPKTKGQWL